jgi:hypothetical protein
VSGKDKAAEQGEGMSTKTERLSAVELIEVVSALRLAADKYTEIAHNRSDLGWHNTAAAYTKWAARCLDIAAKLEDCDTVAIETDEMDEPQGTNIGDAANRYWGRDNQVHDAEH